MMNKIISKKTAFICIILAFMIFSASMLYSCVKKPDIYNLIEYLLNIKSNPEVSNHYDAELNIKINKDELIKEGILSEVEKQLDTVPDELAFNVSGFYGDGGDFSMTVALVQPQSENQEENQNLQMKLYKDNNNLYVQLNDLSKIIIDLLYSAGFIDTPVKNLFDGELEYDGDYTLCFDLTNFNLSYFDKYTAQTEKAFTVKSSVEYSFWTPIKPIDYSDGFFKDDQAKTKIIYFSDIKTKIDKELLKFPYYRYSELNLVIETDKNNDSFLNILGIRESGEANILEKFKLECDLSVLSKARDNPDAVLTENIIPMRYIFELLGETVGWDETLEQAYITQNNKQIYFDGVLFNSKTYTNLLQIMGKTSYNVKSAEAGEYIEITIARAKK